jgi:hypothetical protein
VIKAVTLILLLCSSANAQLGVGDSKEQARIALSSFGINFDSAYAGGKVKSYVADSIMVANRMNRVTAYVNDTIVYKLMYEINDIDSEAFKWRIHELIKTNLTNYRYNDHNITFHLDYPTFTIDIGYHRRKRYSRYVEQLK